MRLSPPAVHMPVPHLAGCRHQGNFSPDSRKPFAQHHGQHLHLCLRGTWDFPHHQRPGPGGHPQRQRGPAEETGCRGTLQSGCTAANQEQPDHTRRLMGYLLMWKGHDRLPKPLLETEVRYRSEPGAGSEVWGCWWPQETTSVVTTQGTLLKIIGVSPLAMFERSLYFLTAVKVAHWRKEEHPHKGVLLLFQSKVQIAREEKKEQ